MAHAQKPDFVFRAKRTRPFKSAIGEGWGASVQSTTAQQGTAVAQCLRSCATNRKVAGSIPADVIRIS